MYYEMKHYRVGTADTINFVRILGREFLHFEVSDEREMVTYYGIKRHVEVVRTFTVHALPGIHEWIQSELKRQKIECVIQD